LRKWSMQKSVVFVLIIFVFVLIWFALLYTAIFELPINGKQETLRKVKTFNLVLNNNIIKKTFKEGSEETTDNQLKDSQLNAIVSPQIKAARKYKHRDLILKQPPLSPNRYKLTRAVYPPPPIEEIERNMTIYLQALHSKFSVMTGPKVDALEVWETYLDLTKSMVMKWDDENYHRIPRPRKDGSIFVSLGTYRDPFCPMTIKSLYSMAKDPEKLFVGMFQQNCFGPVCRTGVLVGGKVEDAGPDLDCYVEFCNSEEGINSNACKNGNVHLFNVNETESLGPYMARYLGSKFYRGEQYYLQIDSHSEFVQDWDAKLVQMVRDAPAEKPVISTYPPDSTMKWRDTVGYRLCDSEFAAAQIEWQIIRLGTSLPFDKSIPAVPKYAPFIAAGFFFCSADFLHEVPFDPFLPWIFMGEEISMSARLWTSGYDIFSPTSNVLNHYYVRRHYPKFWETINRYCK
jgi:[Skp1-protein]-hydroxyproline N-acetylglucosaminyltransferase